MLITLHSIHLLQMWFWYGAVVFYFSKELAVAHRPGIGAEYLSTANEARETIKWLSEQIPRLLEEQKQEHGAPE